MSATRVCFLIRPTFRATVWLIRSSNAQCPSKPLSGAEVCTARVKVGIVQMITATDGDLLPADDFFPPTKDPRWPASCQHCAREFGKMDPYSVGHEPFWERVDGEGGPFLLADATPGAMWDATWNPEAWQGQDGQSLIVKTPGGEWCIDGPSDKSEGRGGVWTREGIAPKLTVKPSISQPKWHGWLTAGVLESI